MIRTLLIIAAVGFVLAIACFSGAIAVAGGPFHIGPHLDFQRVTVLCPPSGERSDGAQTERATRLTPAALVNGELVDSASFKSGR